MGDPGPFSIEFILELLVLEFVLEELVCGLVPLSPETLDVSEFCVGIETVVMGKLGAEGVANELTVFTVDVVA